MIELPFSRDANLTSAALWHHNKKRHFILPHNVHPLRWEFSDVCIPSFCFTLLLQHLFGKVLSNCIRNKAVATFLDGGRVEQKCVLSRPKHVFLISFHTSALNHLLSVPSFGSPGCFQFGYILVFWISTCGLIYLALTEPERHDLMLRLSR